MSEIRMDRDRFPADPWRLVERQTPENRNKSDSRETAGSPVSATLFTLANGYIGVRGDGDGTRRLGHGTLLNGFHETYRIHHAEQAYGFASVGQVTQPVPDGVGWEVRVDGALLAPAGESATLESSEQELDFRTGVWTRTQVWRVPPFSGVTVVERRMVALFERHLVVTTLSVTPDSPCRVEIVSQLNDQAEQEADSSDPRVAEQAVGGGFDMIDHRSESPNPRQQGEAYASYRCRNSRLAMAVGVLTDYGPDGMTGEGFPERDGRIEVVADGPVDVVRYLAYHSDHVPPEGVRSGLSVVEDAPSGVLEDLCAQTLHQAQAYGVDALMARQADFLSDFWERSDVEVELLHDAEGSQDGFQQAVRWALFHIAQVSAQTPGGIAAKGLSGSGYSGHYFWDTEVFVVPFLTYTDPAAARRVLSFRFQMLPAARRRAREMDLAGALFPWRTINGEEASAYYPAGTAQYHIDADVAYAVCQYVAATGDREFLASQGAEILVETARMWADLGFFGADGDFHIHAVTGPDEYSAVVDDNFYTNAMARFNLLAAADAVEGLRREGASTSVSAEEVAGWRAAADRMCLKKDPVLTVHLQDSHFLTREPWDFPDIDSRPLFLKYHPLVIYRRQVLKQADVVLALHLLSDQFADEEKRADFEYYEPLTTGDSTLSSCTQAVVAAEVGRTDLALAHLAASLFTDLADLHGNTDSGVHIAAAAGVWTALVAGFGGLRDSGTRPVLNPPPLPLGWRTLRFVVGLGPSRVRARLSRITLRLELVKGPGVTIPVHGEPVRLTPENPVMEVACRPCRPAATRTSSSSGGGV